MKRLVFRDTTVPPNDSSDSLCLYKTSFRPRGETERTRTRKPMLECMSELNSLKYWVKNVPRIGREREWEREIHDQESNLELKECILMVCHCRDHQGMTQSDGFGFPVKGLKRKKDTGSNTNRYSL